MINKSRSTLDDNGILIGFGFGGHITKDRYFIEVNFYRTAKEYVICLSEGPLGNLSLQERAKIQRESLGKQASGFAPYAVRSIENKLDYEVFKKLMAGSLENVTFEWYK